MYKHLNFDAIILENEKLKISILPKLGFKIASIFNKDKEVEYLFQPTKKEYNEAKYADGFEKYDTSGIDDCIPTIDSCKYPLNKEISLPDHGDTWSLEWDVEECLEKKAVGTVKLPSLPLQFTKSIELEENKINIDYKIKNLSGERVFYLWAFHGLLNYDEYTELEFEENLKNYINVQNDEVWDFDIYKLKNFKENHTFKYYFTDEIKEGFAILDHTKEKSKFKINFDPNKLPYMGVWLTTGGFKNEKNVAIEPCNGYYDSLEKAYENGKADYVEGSSENKWNILIDIIDY